MEDKSLIRGRTSGSLVTTTTTTMEKPENSEKQSEKSLQRTGNEGADMGGLDKCEGMQPRASTVEPSAPVARSRDGQQHSGEDSDEPPSSAPLSRTRSTVSRIPTATQNPSFSFPREVAFVTLICLAQLTTQAGLAQAIAPLHAIGASFDNPSAGQLSWLPAAFSLTVGTFILPAGRWGDLYGHRRLFIIGWIFYAVWTLVAGFAVFSHNFIFFAFCRAMQGIGPAILLPNALAILGRTYPPGKRKNMVFSLFGATAPNGFLLGALFAGVFTEFAWWLWTYWLGSIVMVVCAVLVPFVIPPTPIHGGSPLTEELDLWGTFTGVLGLILVNFAWNEGPAAGWDKVYVYVLLIAGALSLAVFFWIEFKVTRFPLLPRWVFNLDNNLVLGCISLGWGSFGIWVYYQWQLQQIIRGHSILLTVAQQVPAGICGVLAAVITGLALGSIGPGWTMLIAMLAFLLGNLLLAITDPSVVYWAYLFVSNAITPFGMDMSFPAGTLIMSNFMPAEHQGMAASILLVIQNYSISIGLGMAGTVEAHVSGGNLLKGYRGAWYLAIGLDVFGLVLAAWLTLILMRRNKAEAKEQAEEEKPSA